MLLFSMRRPSSRRGSSEQPRKAFGREHVERLVIDVETGLRGFIITADERFLQPWEAAQAAFPEQAQTLLQLVSGDPEQLRLAQRIEASGTSYIEDYSMPLVDAARRGEAFPRSTK